MDITYDNLFIDNHFSGSVSSFGRIAIASGNAKIPLTSIVRNLTPVPKWDDTLSTAIDHSFSIITPIRTSIYVSKYQNLWNLMRLDGVTELPGTLSKVATGVEIGLGIVGVVISGYEKYASGASLSSSMVGGLISAGISIGGMYVTTGMVAAIGLASGINYLITELEIGGKTIEGHLNSFVEWLIFWD